MEESEDFDSFERTRPMDGSGGGLPPGGNAIGGIPGDSDREPERIGRYRIQRKIGAGGFGVVYLAYDEALHRAVAVKVINRGAFDKSEKGLMEEGRTLALLDHPGIVTVHDIGKEDGRIYFVSTFVDGRTLRDYIRQERLDPEAAAALIAAITDALGYAHSRSVIHRDIKPNNIIINPEGRPILIDFGVALAVGQQAGRAQRRSILGTPSYMSPEQARGESHLVDGRSDIYSLGVILYEMLTGIRPFEGRTEDLIEKVASPTLEARPPRQVNPEIPKAIERICLKALAKRTGDRYATAQDLQEDLRAFIGKSKEDASGETKSFRTGVVIPKGLRSFDDADSDFFLQLLPGLRDQAGIPDSIRFWQRGIANLDDPFRVGLLYGPSGSGKSSFLKAGLLPLLPDHVEVIFVAAVVGNTEATLLDRLRERFPYFDEELSLSECVRRIRMEKQIRNSGKLLIVIDQFEQWLHANGRAPESELVAALRHCDGKAVQFLLTLRDDFWMAIGQLMEDIDVDLLQSHNTAAIDLFDRSHARRVLVEFGRAYERIPPGEGELSDEQSEFVHAALGDMEQDGKTIPLQLALFAEMAKSVDWTKESYEKLGGATAIGVEFLGSVFSSRSANPAHRAVEKEARAILEALLPVGDLQIRGRPLEESELMEKSGLSGNPAKFATTVRILDSELKLITPVDSSSQSEPEGDAEKRYQLTHDYLVPSLRGWLFESHRSTIRGRAFLRLNELSGSWLGTRDQRHLPSFWEWLRIRLLVPGSRFTDHDRDFMKSADLKNGRQAGVFLSFVALAAAGFGYFSFRSSVARAVDRVIHADITELPRLLSSEQLSKESGAEALKELMASGALVENQKLNASLALLKTDPSQSEFLFSKLESLPVESHRVVCDSLQPFGENLKSKAWNRVEQAEVLGYEKLRQFAFLAEIDPGNPNWEEKGKLAVVSLLSAPEVEIARWCRRFKPVRRHFEPELARESEAQKSDRLASRKLAIARVELSADDIDGLLTLLNELQMADLAIVAEKFESAGSRAIPRLEMQAELDFPLKGPEAARETLGNQKARAGAILLRLGSPEPVWPLFAAGPDPICRTFLIHVIPAAGVNPELVFEKAISEDAQLELRIGLIQCLGEFELEDFSPDMRKRVVGWLREASLKDPDPGILSSSSWVLQEWGINSSPGESGADRSGEDGGSHRWFSIPTGEVFSICRMDSKGSDSKGRSRAFGIALTEVSARQFLRSSIRTDFDQAKMPFEDCPVGDVSMEEAMAYCNWLSARVNIPESQWCYREMGEGSNRSITPFPDLLERTGFRLPTVEEWVFAARAGTTTERYSGSGSVMVHTIGWSSANAVEGLLSPVGRLKPNDFGLFDVLGNSMEWCHVFSANNTGSVVGGSVVSPTLDLTVGARHHLHPSNRSPLLGFRIVKSLPDTIRD